jgi:hypothetical protein
VSRALLVLGGVAAGTAAAWAVSGDTASAAAMGEPAGSSNSVTDTTVAGHGDAAQAVAQFVGDVSGVAAAAWHGAACQQDATSWSVPSSESALRPLSPGCTARDQIGGPLRQLGSHPAIDQNVSDRLHSAVSDLADTALSHPVERTLSAMDHIATKPQDAPQVITDSLTSSPDLGKKVWDLLNQHGQNGTDGLFPLPVFANLPGLPAAPGTSPETPQDPRDAVHNAGQTSVELPEPAEAQYASRLAHSADVAGTNSISPHSDQGVPTPFAPVGSPVAPLSAPTAPGAPGSAPGGHFDGQAYGVPAWQAAAHNNAMTGKLPVSVRYMPLTPGSQPGVTPD